MTPYERLVALYDRQPEICGGKSLAWYIDVYCRHGFVFSRPDFFIMGRPVVAFLDPEKIMQCDFDFHWHRCDCWQIEAMAGNCAKAFDIMPWPLPWLCFCRWFQDKRGLRFVETHRALRFFRSETLNQENRDGRPQDSNDRPNDSADHPGGASGHEHQC